MKLPDLARQGKHRLFLREQDVARVRAMASTRRNTVFREQYRAARVGMALPPLPSGTGPWGVCMARDEADVIEASVRHMAHQGVPHLLVVDNGSTDGTLDRLRALQGELPGLHVGTDHEPAYFQSAKMTFLADVVRSAGARWIIPFDADEFWFGESGSVAETLSASRATVVRASIHNAFPSASAPGLWIDPEPHPDVKAAFRARRGAVVAMGNHDALRPGARATDLRLVHVPWRSREQFLRKTAQGSRALDAAAVPPDLATHWRYLASQSPAAAAALWSDILAGSGPEEMVWRPRGALRSLGPCVPGTWQEVVQAMNSGRNGHQAEPGEDHTGAP